MAEIQVTVVEYHSDVIDLSAERLGLTKQQFEGDHPSAELIVSILFMLRNGLIGPERKIVTIHRNGRVPLFARILKELPDGIDDKFSRDVVKVWNSHTVGVVVPIVVTRMLPTPLTGLMIVPLPWVKNPVYCPQCGSESHTFHSA